jgi:hypothetical protein
MTTNKKLTMNFFETECESATLFICDGKLFFKLF